MKCPKCQFENPDNAKFCTECASPMEFHCPNCGAITPGTGKFCQECAYDLSKPKEALPIDYSEPQSYTPKHLSDKILNTRSAIEGERKLVTVLFADVANYTSLSEKLDPEEVHNIMDGCFKILMDEIHKYEGTINQFTGDGVMALFGAPIAHEDHAQRACHAALSIQQVIGSYSEKVNKDCGADFHMRIGINSGPVIVGSIGDDLRMDYTAVGDTTNLAARMESMAGPGAIYISSNTQRLARDFFEFKSLGKVEVKGKEDPQEAFELIKTGEVETRIGASVAKGLTRFVGRKNSMSALMEVFDKVKSGSGQVVGLVGEAGVGKSRLLLEMRNMLPQGEYLYIEGRCLHYGGSMIYLPILDILKSYFEIKEGDREFIIKKKMEEKIIDLDEKLKGILTPFQDLLSLQVEDEAFTKLEPKEKRERTFEAIRDLLIRVSHEKILVLAVEDLHWIDKTSEEFLGYLIDWLANTPIMLMLLYRPEYTHPWGSKSYYTKVGVDQLGTPSSTELVQSILEEGQVAPELKQLILNRSAGNPLFMEEFTHTLLENGSIEKKDNEYVLSRKAADIEVPDTIQGIIAARMDRLEDNIKRTMQVASVIGRDFAFRILHTITGMKEELKSYLVNLQGLEFIYEKQLFPELEYIFKHILTQEVAYNSLLVKRRKEIHEKIGKAIEEIYMDRLEEFYEMLAYHYSKGDNFEKASYYLKLAGQKAASKHSPYEALHFYKEALSTLKKMPESEINKKEQIEVCLMTYIPAVVLNFPEDSIQIFIHGANLSEEVMDERSLAQLYSMISIFHNFRGNISDGLQYAEKGFHLAEKLDDIEIMAPTAIDLCLAYDLTGRLTDSVKIIPKILSLLEKEEKRYDFFNKAQAIYPSLCAMYGAEVSNLGNFEQGKIYCEKALQIAKEIDDPRTLSFVELLYGSFYCLKGEGKLALDHAQNAFDNAEKAKWEWYLGIAWMLFGIAYYLCGDLEVARDKLEKALEIQNEIGNEAYIGWCYYYLAMTHFDLGNKETAQNYIDKALKLSLKNKQKSGEGSSKILLGRILGNTDTSRTKEAEAYILEGIHILETLKLKSQYSIGYLVLAELLANTGHKFKALMNLFKARRMFKEMRMDYWLEKAKILS